VGLLGIQGQDPVSHLGLGKHERDDRPAADLPKSGGAVVAVGRPVEPLLGPDRDDRIEEAVEPTDHV